MYQSLSIDVNLVKLHKIPGMSLKCNITVH